MEAALAGDGGRNPFQDGSHGIQEQQVLPLSEHGRIKEDRGEEDGEGQEHLDQVLDVTKEETGGGEENGQAGRQDDQQGDQAGQPQQAPARRKAQENQNDRQHATGDQKVYELGQNRAQG